MIGKGSTKSSGDKPGKCRLSSVCLLWYMVGVLFTSMMLLWKNSDGARFFHMMGGASVGDRLLEFMLPTESDSFLSHIPGTSVYGAATVSQLREHVDCFSKSGKWVYDPEPRYMVPDVFASGGLKVCEKTFLKSIPGAVAGDAANVIAAKIAAGNASAAEWKVREDLKWEWQTDAEACRLRPVDRDEFCRRIGSKRNILVVGDSINQELYWTLLNNLVVNRSGWKLPRASNERHTQGDLEVCSDVLGGPGHGFRIGHIRNDRLSLIQRRLEDGKTNFYEFPWINFVEPWNISMFIFNRGAHFESDGNYTESLINVFSVIKARWPSAQVFYRSTPPGHLNCTDHYEPFKEREPEEKLMTYKPTFHWGEFVQQNEIARNITERFGHIFLDLDAMIALRPDAHLKAADCLHYCMPGPLDVFAKLFYNTLLLLPTRAQP